MRKMILLTLFLIVFLFPNCALAETRFPIHESHFITNGQTIHMDAEPFTENGYSYVPIRYLAQALGITDIKWIPESKTVTLTKENNNVSLIIGNKTVFINGQPVLSNVTPKMLNGRTYLPARIIAEAFNYSVSWDSITQTVILTPGQNSQERKKLSSQEIVELIQPTVVLIETQRGQGSGFFVSDDGEILTNAHVVRGSKWIKVTTADERVFKATIKKISNPWDIAILKIDANDKFPFIEYYTESDNVSEGEDVIVFGNPLGLKGTVTKGIVSAKRDLSPSNAWETTIKTIQYDAPTDQGSSGGPVVNAYGEWIGVNFAGYKGNDFNFAIPAEYYYYLSLDGEDYNERKDWNSFYTEQWEWYDKFNSIMSLYESSDTHTTKVNTLNYQLTELEKLYQEVINYYPKYQEIENLLQLFLEVLEENYKLIQLTLEINENPYAYTEYTVNNTIQKAKLSVEIYFDEMEKMFDKYD